MLRRNGPVVKSVESVLRLEGSLWWERFVKEVGLSRQWKREGVMDGESGELTEWEEVVGAWTGRAETEGLKCGWRRELASWFQRQGEAYRKEPSCKTVHRRLERQFSSASLDNIGVDHWLTFALQFTSTTKGLFTLRTYQRVSAPHSLWTALKGCG